MTTLQNASVSLAAGALVVLATASAARAQATHQPGANQNPRQGFTIGFGVGLGQMSCESIGEQDICDGVTEAGGAELHVGTMLRPALALNGDIWIMMHTEDYVTVSQAITTVGVTFWIAPRLWVRGGLGGAVAQWRYKGPLGINLEDSTESVPAVMGAIGYELKPDRDLSSLREALNAYRQLVTLYPNSPYATEAESRMAEVREVLAEHEWMVAAFYTRNKRWRGAQWRLEYLKQNYPEYSGIERVDEELLKIETKIAEQEEQFKKYMEERQQKAAKRDKQKS